LSKIFAVLYWFGAKEGEGRKKIEWDELNCALQEEGRLCSRRADTNPDKALF